jgi:transposase-like protein
MPQDRFFSARVFSPAFKLAAVSRVEAGEPIGAVAQDLGLARRVLYRWREVWRVEGGSWAESQTGAQSGLAQAATGSAAGQ